MFGCTKERNEEKNGNCLWATLLVACLLNLLLFILSSTSLQTCESSPETNTTTIDLSSTNRPTNPPVRIILFVICPCIFLPILPLLLQIVTYKRWSTVPELRVVVGFFCTIGFISLSVWGAMASHCINTVSLTTHMVISSTTVVLFQNLQQLIQRDTFVQALPVGEEHDVGNELDDEENELIETV